MELSRISACTYPLREKPWDHALRVLADSGVHKADLWGREPHFPEDANEEAVEEIRAGARRIGVAIANLGTYPGAGFASDDENQRRDELARMKNTIDAAQRLGARSIRVLPGRGEDPAVIDRIAPLMAESADYAESLGVYLGMENHGGSIAGNPQHAARLCRAVGSPHFGVLYEPCNLLHAGVDYREAFDLFSEWIVHVHIKDGRRTGAGFQRTHLGEGDVQPEWVVDALGGIGYEGDYALEYEIQDIEPVESGLTKWVERFRAT
ncbi:MAG: sugar phosphate isomerase/epimerase family protein [Armatimonadota bacterium]